MAVQTSLPALLDTLTQSLGSALEATPKIAGVEPSKDGVSLLDIKNEILLSYLQNLVFLILLKIRTSRSADGSSDLPESAVTKLVELRLYLEKGVRPLEEKLHFQLDKILRAADTAERHEQQAKQIQDAAETSDSADEDENEDDDDEAAAVPAHDADKRSGPGFNFTRTSQPRGMAAAATTSSEDKTGVYRPPKITPTVMPTTERRERIERRPMKSATMDEYIASEMSSAPVAEPSVGTNVVARGRKVKTAGERAEEDRRREYEESNFTRLPKESKKDRAKRSKAEGRNSRMQFGGEDFRELGEGVERISRLTRRKEGVSGTRALLERSRKRGRDIEDSGRGDGLSAGTREMGDSFRKKVRVMEGGRRDRGKR